MMSQLMMYQQMMYQLMMSQLMLLFCVTLSYGQAGNVTSTSVIPYNPHHDDVCTNECKETDPHYWCGEHREDASGRVMRCVQYTKYGGICVAECGGKEAYNYCLINAYKLEDGNDWWEYCSLVGYTINKDPCTDECGMRGEKYFWCHTDSADTAKWDYCSPPGLVKPVQFTIKGVECISECRQGGENYHWCTRSMSYCDDDSCDDDWDYCSLDQDHTRYNYRCEEPCGNEGGTSYYWCNKEGGSWDYCSPTPRLGVHISDHVELTRYGVKCRDICGLKGEDYYWCSQHGGSVWSWWEYCSPSPNTTINQGQCTDQCGTRGSSYFWCHTADSWDYCSPLYVAGGGLGYESVGGEGKLKHQTKMVTLLVVAILLQG
eukprot:GFUD01024473.1.p1 GENE.GFUD01024473.1~~GFUD01024473.1.p1  ORF type:complete len:374 (+),score=109.61 GFUD01024473.1:126-1247(+)